MLHVAIVYRRYRNGLTGVDLDKAMKKYKSHRRVAQVFADASSTGVPGHIIISNND